MSKSSTKFMVYGSSISVVALNAATALDKLPSQIYTIQFDKQRGFYLDITKDQLQVPAKIYGNAHERVEKCIKTYRERNTSTGILLTGDKGTGKTLLMSLLANRMITELELPVILIKEAHVGEQFASFIELLGECCLIFDEFGKMYSSQKSNSVRDEENRPASQDALLSLMDGVDKTKRMIILSENRELNISEYMLNRPSRIYYHFRYRKLDENSIVGYCEDHDVPDAVIGELIELSRRSRIFSFDMLQSIVEEYLRFGSPLNEIVTELNIDTSQESSVMVEIMKVTSKVSNTDCKLLSHRIIAKPGSSEDYVYLKVEGSEIPQVDEWGDVVGGGEEDEKTDNVYLRPQNLVYESAGKLIYETDRFTVIAKEMPRSYTRYQDLF